MLLSLQAQRGGDKGGREEVAAMQQQLEALEAQLQGISLEREQLLSQVIQP